MNAKPFVKLVKVEETLFGLPWTLAGALLPFCAADFRVAGHGWTRWLLIVLGFVFARSAGMAFNRLIDRKIDAANQRTCNRQLPAGEITTTQVASFAVLCSLFFMITCACINSICLVLSPIVMALLFLYSYTKRFTPLCHLVLGLIQFFGPFFAWAAITDTWSIAPILLGLALLASIAAMDIIYALQDLEFDLTHHLNSIPAALGVSGSLRMARQLHGLAVIFLLLLGRTLTLPIIYYCGVAFIAGIYVYHHRLLDPHRPEQINNAFFRCNSLVGLTLLTSTIGTLLWRASL